MVVDAEHSNGNVKTSGFLIQRQTVGIDAVWVGVN